jgi:hypothetical protein
MRITERKADVATRCLGRDHHRGSVTLESPDGHYACPPDADYSLLE